MANGEFEFTDRIADALRKLIDYPEGEHGPYPVFLFPVRDEGAFGPRARQLTRDFRIFRTAVWFLRAFNRETMPGVYFKRGSLPSSPENAYLQLSNDPVSAALREAWSAHREQREPRHDESVKEGSVIEMPLEESITVLSNGLANAFVTAAASGSPGVVHFTVNSQNHHYRVHVTEQYWYSPVIFGSKLSTPVGDDLSPANYRFGGEKAGSPIIWDSGIHVVSASHTSTTVTSF